MRPEAPDPIACIAACLGPGGRCLWMPNGGNLGDNLIAAATIQRFERARLPWTFIRGQRRSVGPRDVLVFGGGGSLVAHYAGGVQCVASLLALGAPVVVLPQTANGHESFWRGVSTVTVFCRDAASLAHMRQFGHLASWPADDLAVDLDLTQDPLATVQALRQSLATQGRERVLEAFRSDPEAARPQPEGALDISACAYPPLTSTASIYGSACAFLAVLATYTEIRTDRLHVAIAGGLLGVPTLLLEDRYGKNRGVFEASLQHRFPCVRLGGA